MEPTVLNIILSILLLFVVPLLAGNEICGLFKLDRTLSKSFVLGEVGIWAVCQIITVPLVMLKANFMAVVWLLSIITVGLIAHGIYKKWFVKWILPTSTIGQKIALVVMLLAIAALLVTSTVLQHTDADDSRFVVNAVDIVRTNTMFLTNPATGEALEVWEGELIKDVTSPWAVYIAYLAKLTGIHVTIMAHTIMPVMLLLMACCVFWMLSEEFFGGDITHRCIFVCLVLLLNVYGNYSEYNAETFLLTRIWQGKAVVAGIGIPLMILVFLWLYRYTKSGRADSEIVYIEVKDPGKRKYGLLLMLQFAMCHLSGMGIIIGAVMAGCYGLVYGISKKDWKMMLGMWLTVIPNVTYYLINSVL